MAPSWPAAHASSQARTSLGRSEARSAGTCMPARADLPYEASGGWTAARSTTQIITVTSWSSLTPTLGWASSGAPRERKNAMYCSSSARVAPSAKARRSWRASMSSGRTAITSAAGTWPANAARLSRGRVAEPYWCRSVHPAAADGRAKRPSKDLTLAFPRRQGCCTTIKGPREPCLWGLLTGWTARESVQPVAGAVPDCQPPPAAGRPLAQGML